MATDNPMIVKPGQTSLFRYLGEQVPNQVIFASPDKLPGARINLSSPTSWSLWYMEVPAGEPLSLMVQFPSSLFSVTNSGQVPILVGGDGIFPANSSEQA